MFISDAIVEKCIELENQVYLLKLYCPRISSIIKPGQFLNVKVTETTYPLLRRPFSVCDVEGDYFYLMFNIYGDGTKILAGKQKGDSVDILGPLGNGFNIDGDFETAIIVAGGLGAAPFPYFIRKLDSSKNVHCFIGGRTSADVIKYRMKNLLVSTDDGSEGHKGTVVELLNENLEVLKQSKTKLFGCGPNAMLRALKEFAIKNELECEASVECAMACGFGICQGCPIEAVNRPEKYFLVCKDGPIFNVRDVII